MYACMYVCVCNVMYGRMCICVCMQCIFSSGIGDGKSSDVISNNFSVMTC